MLLQTAGAADIGNSRIQLHVDVTLAELNKSDLKSYVEERENIHANDTAGKAGKSIMKPSASTQIKVQFNVLPPSNDVFSFSPCASGRSGTVGHYQYD